MLSSHNIVEQLVKGNQLALQWVYTEYVESIYQLAIYILKEEEHAHEIVQDSFLQLWNKRKDLDKSANIKGFLFVICRNKSFNRLKEILRHRSRFVEIGAQDVEAFYFHEEEHLAEQDLHNVLEEIINKLPLRQRTVFRLSRIEGLSHQEIAEKLQISKNTVKNHLISALKYVREELEQAGLQSSVFLFLTLMLYC